MTAGTFHMLDPRAMRHVPLDHQRNRQAVKRGGDVAHVELTSEPCGDDEQVVD